MKEVKAHNWCQKAEDEDEPDNEDERDDVGWDVGALGEEYRQDLDENLSELGNEDDLPAPPNQSALVRWLQASQKQLSKLFRMRKQDSKDLKRRRPQRYARKGEQQSRRTEQRHNKQKREKDDWLRKKNIPQLTRWFSAKPKDLPMVSDNDESNHEGDPTSRSPSPMSHISITSGSDDDGSSSIEFAFDFRAAMDDLNDDGEDEKDDEKDQDWGGDGDDRFGIEVAGGHGVEQEDGLTERSDIPHDRAHECLPTLEIEAFLLEATGRYVEPPSPDLVQNAITSLEELLRLRRATGPRRVDPKLNLLFRTRLETMAAFLRLYRASDYKDWTGSSLAAAQAAGRGVWLSRRLREWVHDYIKTGRVPENIYGRWNSSILDDEDLAMEILLHLQGIGKYVRALDIVHYLQTPEMKARLNLSKPISERTAARWMNSPALGYRWGKTPQGLYADGHEREDVVDHRQTVFLPAMAALEPGMRQYAGVYNPKTRQYVDNVMEEVFGPREEHTPARKLVVHFHDESTFYANDRRKLRWIHETETAVPYQKGEGVSLMVSDFVSADYGWLRSPDG